MGEVLNFNDVFQTRTKKFAIAIIHFYAENCKKSEELRIIGKQLLRSGTSVAANFRAYIRGRSDAERFAKMCIVVEETDETFFGLELLEESELIDQNLVSNLKNESFELLKVFSSVRAKMKSK
ncbi:four helix bundle protein [Paludibacter sp. 221]|uniref:four helix bundle protein n=1 Tax=Paludibacter sp. 221 TaxID=2302939 RepID=UPI0013D80364|nr:four helix bundle protein [Paludibacter sp. 221]NDV46310.1 four helix bundle protein [Paludibacter sp. 221]